MDEASLLGQLYDEIELASERVYAVSGPTPLEPVTVGGGVDVWVKREDIPPIHAYKWRGAYNKMASLSPDALAKGVVCASAGNHAQGVAIAAHKLGCEATIFMPKPTPLMKRQAVALHGRERVRVQLVGDTYDDASSAARQFAEQTGAAFVHPYDDLATMGGQGTIAVEAADQAGQPFDAVYLQIGGGGMAAAVGAWLKKRWPGIRVVGVEGAGQASMKAAIENDGPVRLDRLDIFCDGTAVRRAGDTTYQLCKEVVDEFITVTNDEVCNAIRLFWEARRRIVEPPAS